MGSLRGHTRQTPGHPGELQVFQGTLGGAPRRLSLGLANAVHTRVGLRKFFSRQVLRLRLQIQLLP